MRQISLIPDPLVHTLFTVLLKKTVLLFALTFVIQFIEDLGNDIVAI